ncbi:DUF5993 family protein [Leucobacter sp. gxy201]|uniref:DUF5993 family protein n=1 Tax=Leucobacter sp. gxy201 TaxID=2957200 RepID=UPI003D9FEF39
MDAIVFLLILGATGVAVFDDRKWVVLGSFAIAFVAAAALFMHHVTDQLPVSL